MIPEFPDSPPIGMAAKVTTEGIEGHFVVTAETLGTIGDIVAKIAARLLAQLHRRNS